MQTNFLEKLDDGNFTGNYATYDADIDFSLIPMAEKTTKKAPDFTVITRSPKGNPVEMGAAWSKNSRAGNDYLSIVLRLRTGQININAVEDAKNKKGPMKIIEFADSLAA